MVDKCKALVGEGETLIRLKSSILHFNGSKHKNVDCMYHNTGRKSDMVTVKQ